MTANAVFRESVEIFYYEGHGWAAYLYLLVIIAPVQLLSLYLPSLDAQTWSGSASLFKVCAVTALLLMVYFALRVANQEFSPWRFQPLTRWSRDHDLPISSISRAQIAFLSLHVGISILLCSPFLLWAAAISRTPWVAIAATFVLLPFYALTYGVWGLASFVYWERRLESRQVLMRAFIFCLVTISSLVYLPLNPMAYLLSCVGRQELPPFAVGGWQGSATSLHFAFHLLLGGSGLSAYLWVLKRRLAS
jgi:hypothetical protein